MTRFPRPALASVLAFIGASALHGCGGGSDGAPPASAASNEAREQDRRAFSLDLAALPQTLVPSTPSELAGNGAFLALPGSDTDRWVGALGNSSYQIEVPRNWNGMLVMWAHGLRSDPTALTVEPPRIRKYLVEHGYAWAASSYSRNYYDARAGVEDSNALALAFGSIAADRGRALAAPTRVYIMGESLGGHVAAAAIDEETIQTASHKMRYHGAVATCGNLGDSELFDYYAAYQMAAQQLTVQPATTDWRAISYAPTQVRDALFVRFPDVAAAVVTPAGEKLKQIVKNLSGGQRPGFDAGFAAPAGFGTTATVWSLFGSDATVRGILGKPGLDTTRFVYQLDNDAALSAEETAFNAAALRLKGDPQANRMRSDGVRWIPKANGNISVPFVTLHTLGDTFVPFSMQQLYKRRADALGTSGKLVQRAIRGFTHCDFRIAEQEEAFADMVRWEQGGAKPLGDDVLTPAVVADPNYGCKFSRAARSDDATPIQSARTALLPVCPAGSASTTF